MKSLVVFLATLTFLTGTVSAAVSLRGSPESMAKQNEQADKEKLSRLWEKDLENFKKKKLLVPIPDGKRGVIVDDRLQEKYSWVRPWTSRFLVDFRGDFEKNLNDVPQVNSAVRTVEYQRKLRKENKNAASAEPGPRQSSHLTGSTVDIGKKDMSPRQLKWVRNYLLALKKRGLIEAIEEKHQAVFHIMVFKKYKKIK